MSVTRLPSGRWRAQVHDPSTGTNISVSKLLGGPGTFRTKTEAKAAREKARERLAVERGDDGVTVAAFAERWTIDPLFSRPKESTNIFNRERINHFVRRYGPLPLANVDDRVVAEWLAGGKHIGAALARSARHDRSRHGARRSGARRRRSISAKLMYKGRRPSPLAS